LEILDDVKISKEQLQTLFKTMSNETNLKTLTLYRGNEMDETEFSDIDPCDFANGVSKLSKLSLRGHISLNQLNALFKRLVESSHVKDLEIGYCASFDHNEFLCSLTNVNPILFKEAIHKLDKFALKCTGQCSAGWQLETFQNIHEDDMKKMHLDTEGSRWGVATDNLPKLMKLFAKLESLNIARTRLDKLSEPLFKQ
jgi:hypothetical protein